RCARRWSRSSNRRTSSLPVLPPRGRLPMSAANHHVDPLVDDYVHDLLPDDDAARVESHCAACPGCARALEQARRRLGLLRALPPVEPSAGLVRATLDRIENAPPPRRLLGKRFWVGVAGVLAASIVVL